MEQPQTIRPERSNRSRIWITTLGLIASYLVLGLSLRYPVGEAKILVGGDEQHYLTQALSLLNDGDLMVVNNYEQGDYLTLYNNTLDPSFWNLAGDRGYSGHSPGAGIVVAPGLWAAGWIGVLATLALAVGATFALTAATLARIEARPLSNAILLLLVAGFASLPLLPYSHTLYPETFVMTAIAGLTLCTVIHFQSTVRSRRAAAAIGAISICGLSIGLHPKYFIALLGVVAFFVGFEVYDARRKQAGASFTNALSYVVAAGFWLILFSWLHGLMWDAPYPGGWWVQAKGAKTVSLDRALVQLLDLFVGRENGLFILAPLALLAVAFLVVALRRGSDRLDKRLWVLVAVVVGSIAPLAALSGDWHGGDSPLGRYLAPLVPLLLLVGAHEVVRKSWTLGRGLFLAILFGLGLVQSLTYAALPMAFRPRDGGSGVLDAISDRIAGLENLEAWFWLADGPVSWTGVMIWILTLVAVLSLFVRPERIRPSEVLVTNTDTFEASSPADSPGRPG